MTDFRLIPSIDELRRSAAARALEAEFGPDATLDALRDAATDLRAAIAGGNGDLASEADAAARIETAAAARLRDAFRPSLQPVINATGVVIHTNLGRAPLAPAAIERIAAVARGYSSLEYDIARGARGRRDVHAERLLCRVPVAEDLGSGHLGSEWGRSAVGAGSDPVGMEPAAGETIAGGADLCFFSGDKLLGGPQAGIIVGRAALVDRVRRHPLMRALRVDKMTYAALEATLAEYAAGRAAATIPVQRMLTATADEIRARASAAAAAIGAIAGWRADLVEGSSAVGGGSAPGVSLPTWLVAVQKAGLSADALEARLRQLTPPIVARIERDRLVLDLRTVSPEQDGDLPRLLARVG